MLPMGIVEKIGNEESSKKGKREKGDYPNQKGVSPPHYSFGFRLVWGLSYWGAGLADAGQSTASDAVYFLEDD